MRGILLGAVLVVVLFTAAGCSSASETPSKQDGAKAEVERLSTASVVPAGQPDSREQEQLDADLVKAIDTAKSSMSPDALDAHIRQVTKAPFSMIVAPYDPNAAEETEEFGETWVAGYGTDAAVTTEFQGIIYESGGKPVRDFDPSLTSEPLYFAGRPLPVQGRAGYVLVARPAQ